MMFHRFPTADSKLEIVLPPFHYRSIWVYGCAAISNNFTLGSGIKQYASADSV